MEPKPEPPAEAAKPITKAPVMDVVPPPPEAADAKAPSPPDPKADDSKKPKKDETPPKPKAPKNSGVTLAIVATIIIVLGLAALATYAYLKTAK